MNARMAQVIADRVTSMHPLCARCGVPVAGYGATADMVAGKIETFLHCHGETWTRTISFSSMTVEEALLCGVALW